MVLTGSEIKSIRLAKVSLNDGYCVFINQELWVKNVHIGEYKQASFNNHEPRRMRKLLLKRDELKRLQAKVKEKGFTIVPLQLFLNEKGFAKLDIALVKGKKKYDKRDTIKKKDIKRDMDRASKHF